MNRLMIAGTNSGCGKTTVTCAVLSAFKQRGLSAASFKCGPDYIDTMFHREATGISARNLDPYFCGRAALREQFARGMGKDVSVIEGAMGYYDGIAGTCEASAYTISQATKTPVVLVVNGKGAGSSAGAVIKGFCSYQKGSNIKGVIFNNLNKERYSDMAGIAESLSVKPYGFLPHDPGISIESRHLGLITTAEIENIKEKLTRLGKSAGETLDIDGLLELSRTAGAISLPEKPAGAQKKVRIAVASDKAFCFRYIENIELLSEAGAEIVYFSPLCDSSLPENTGGLYLCGGYPELYKEELSKNAAMLSDIKKAVAGGMPVIAESGGFLLLHETLDGFPMAGAIKGHAYKTEKLQRFGYAELTAKSHNLLCEAGEKIRVHEFHYWDSDAPGNGFIARKAGRGTEHLCAHSTDTMYAGFPHLYFPAKPEIAARFTSKACGFKW